MNAEYETTSNAEYTVFASSKPAAEVMYLLLENGHPFQVLLGSWRGNREVSYIVKGDMQATLERLGLLKGEETILLLGAIDGLSRRYAKIVELEDNSVVNAGYLVHTSKEVAMEQEGWSYSPIEQAFFTITPDEAE